MTTGKRYLAEGSAPAAAIDRGASGQVDGVWGADGFTPLDHLCTCTKCECYKAGTPDDDGRMGWCDGCRMGIHDGIQED